MGFAILIGFILRFVVANSAARGRLARAIGGLARMDWRSPKSGSDTRNPDHSTDVSGFRRVERGRIDYAEHSG
jgi:hypothetical protein